MIVIPFLVSFRNSWTIYEFIFLFNWPRTQSQNDYDCSKSTHSSLLQWYTTFPFTLPGQHASLPFLVTHPSLLRPRSEFSAAFLFRWIIWTIALSSSVCSSCSFTSISMHWHTSGREVHSRSGNVLCEARHTGTYNSMHHWKDHSE